MNIAKWLLDQLKNAPATALVFLWLVLLLAVARGYDLIVLSLGDRGSLRLQEHQTELRQPPHPKTKLPPKE